MVSNLTLEDIPKYFARADEIDRLTKEVLNIMNEIGECQLAYNQLQVAVDLHSKKQETFANAVKIMKNIKTWIQAPREIILENSVNGFPALYRALQIYRETDQFDPEIQKVRNNIGWVLRKMKDQLAYLFRILEKCPQVGMVSNLVSRINNNFVSYQTDYENC